MKKKILTLFLGVATMLGATFAAVACGPIDEGDGSQKTTATISFDVNLDGYQVNDVKPKTVSIGKRVPIVKAYVTGENPSNLQLYGWYTDEACTDSWDFKADRVQGDMTLYAKWVEQYDVNYYVNGALIQTVPTFKGDTLTEDATLVAGFKYMGTYLDEEYETEFSYSDPIQGPTDLYIRRSEGIYMSDHTDPGELPSAALSDYLVAYAGSLSTDTKGNLIEEEGWAETYTVSTQYATGLVQEQCTYVNFGYMPTYGDGYVELCLALDISQSQIIRIWFKNLGKADSVNMYFTALLDADGSNWSETGSVYTQDYCYPNYTGSGVGSGIALEQHQIEMDETDEWTYVDFNLYEVYKNGYSIWGTSNFLGMIRFQANYKNVNYEDWSNEFLIKAIEGVPHEIVVEDSDSVQTLLMNAENTTQQALQNASDAQAENPQGMVFPKDYVVPSTVKDGTRVLNTTDGLLMYTENEVVSREKGKPSYGFELRVPEGKNIDLAELTTLNITLQNFGYAENLTVRIYNELDIPVKADLAISKQMSESKSYTANLYGKYGMEGKLSKIEIIYNAVGVDNAILIKNIEMIGFMPYDIVGINLNDKYCFGLETNSQVDVSFEPNRGGTLFDVKASGASVTSADRTYNATSDGYGYATLQYFLYKDSNVSAVAVEYKINGTFTSRYTYELDTVNKAQAASVKLPLKTNERGYVQAIRISFVGTGKVLVKTIDYEVNEESLPFYQSYEDIYNAMDWDVNCAYAYDGVLKSSIFVKNPTAAVLSMSLYIGYSQNMSEHHSVPHTTKSVLLTGSTKVKIVYQNKTDVDKLTLGLAMSKSDIGASDGEGLDDLTVHSTQEIRCNMQEYEWSTMTVEIPADRAGLYLGKLYVQFAGKEIAVRAISIETGR